MTVDFTVRLRFSDDSRAAATHTNLSAVRLDGRVLWIAGDETATVERLLADSPERPSEFGDEARFRLGDLVRLPGADADEEADVEGLARSGHFLWAVGSHSLRRKQIRDRHDGPRALRRLARVEGQDNRQILVRLPVADVGGVPTPVREMVVDGVTHRAAALSGRDDLRRLLRDDEHLAPFLPIPGKDNGLDIEGIAVHGDRVYLGLRGPVLRGWAFVLELRPYVTADDPARLRLHRFEDGRPYRKHVLDLHGLGVRDLCPDGDDLLVLAGPTMALDGPVRVHRWHGACRTEMPAVVRGELITRELELTFGEGDDHAEGLSMFGDDRILVVYDSPAAARLTADGAVLADVLKLPRR
ncbi:hypothetical protein BJY16_006542 [Actinoplanes octamycinicus]|uniref:DUF3616 domain-containing protein n=1 Tax=Actinoplanes octamycinicus TaxID=135948 RepID=A0A7W7H318_9ACTN|nr:DUF3616 domain-containing protein [Actinoplanes octamycinicus]MBB4743083.1 hypothetical protein [Actinoplanes octamycinicus]GIE61355.1 hypothetical protein Aoc01nite_67570 [Actinoplanes octamycinicus]